MKMTDIEEIDKSNKIIKTTMEVLEREKDIV